MPAAADAISEVTAGSDCRPRTRTDPAHALHISSRMRDREGVNRQTWIRIAVVLVVTIALALIGWLGAPAVAAVTLQDFSVWLRRRGMTARIARRGIESSPRLGRHRERGAGAVVAELLSTLWQCGGSGLGAVLRVHAAGVCARLHRL